VKRSRQLQLLKYTGSAYGGDLLTTRKGRSGPRPLAVNSSMHLVMRSSLAVGIRSFKKYKSQIDAIVEKFAGKHGVTIISSANSGNHLHFHIQLHRRDSYRRFIRAISAAIAMLVMGVSRWRNQMALSKKGFWDRRPFTRVLKSFRERLNLKDYIEINQLEGFGNCRQNARDIVAEWKEESGPPPWQYVET
jgi:REP element-mobilizing transposase RayT